MLSVRKQKVVYTAGREAFTKGGAVHQPLPATPQGMEWNLDPKTKNWSLRPSKDVGWGASDGETSRDHEWEVISKTVSLGVESALGVESVASATSTSSIGDSAKAYVEHFVLPTDTLQGICITYKISATKLRQINSFSGTTLTLAPPILKIPLDRPGKGKGEGDCKISNAFKLHTLGRQFPCLSSKEIKAYLEMTDWDLDEALHVAREDKEWEDGNPEKI
mmetsp:Transcript_39165/g.91246  ORF Transcript_39165/g.91246 Transcript_39165/m.91246 type:complete len:220 (-) Transcript_39165:265-924(-)